MALRLGQLVLEVELQRSLTQGSGLWVDRIERLRWGRREGIRGQTWCVELWGELHIPWRSAPGGVIHGLNARLAGDFIIEIGEPYETVLHVEAHLRGIKNGGVNERLGGRIDTLVSEEEARSIIRWLGHLWCREQVAVVHVRVKGETCALEIH
jgi:hypothetical protein